MRLYAGKHEPERMHRHNSSQLYFKFPVRANPCYSLHKLHSKLQGLKKICFYGSFVGVFKVFLFTYNNPVIFQKLTFFTEEFNDRILMPELSDEVKFSLHEEVKKIYQTYCLEESIDKIRFDPFIVEEIQRSK